MQRVTGRSSDQIVDPDNQTTNRSAAAFFHWWKVSSRRTARLSTRSTATSLLGITVMMAQPITVRLPARTGAPGHGAAATVADAALALAMADAAASRVGRRRPTT